jgi:hypothetical protein
MKIVLRLLRLSFLFLTMVSLQDAMGGGCGPRGCSAVKLTENVRPAPSNVAGSHSFTAAGGSMVAEINLSQEAVAVINAKGKEEPLPKGFVCAADRQKSVAGQEPLYGWEETGGTLRKQSRRYSNVTRAFPNSRTTQRPSQAKVAKPAPAAKVAIAAKAKS